MSAAPREPGVRRTAGGRGGTPRRAEASLARPEDARTLDAVDDGGLGHLEGHHHVKLHVRLVQRLGLLDRAGEAVQQPGLPSSQAQ